MEKKNEPKEIQTVFTENTLDAEYAIEGCGELEIYTNILSVFVSESLNTTLEDIRISMMRGPQKEFRRTTHSLKGAASYFF